MGLSDQEKIVSLQNSHIGEIESLLEQCGLPFADCHELLEHFIGIFDDQRLLAIGATQPQARTALLRSIAVDPESRGQGLAQRMTRYLLESLRAQKVSEVYLLTETAETFFTRFGFQSIDRNSVPEFIKATRQFPFLCPSGARAMRLVL